MRKSVYAAVALACGLAMSSASYADDEVYLDDDEGYSSEETFETAPPPAGTVIEDDDDTVVVRPGPRVYGWYRPENCGTYRYWNGERCVDARWNPPPSSE